MIGIYRHYTGYKVTVVGQASEERPNGTTRTQIIYFKGGKLTAREKEYFESKVIIDKRRCRRFTLISPITDPFREGVCQA